MSIEATCEVASLARRTVVRSFVIGTLSVASASLWTAQDLEIRALYVGNIEPVRPVIEAFQRRHKNFYYGTSLATLASRHGDAVYLIMGPEALAVALEYGLRAPVISIFTSSQTYGQLIAGRGGTSLKQLTAIFAECSPETQLQLTSALFQRRISVGVLLSNATAHLERLLRRAAAINNIDLLVHIVPAEANPIRELNKLAAAAAILAIPDGAIFNSHTLRGLLESTYRRGQAMIGFSTSMVSAGTLATAYAAVDDVVAHVSEIVQGVGQGVVPEPQYPQYWRVEVNKQVARSLNVIVSDRVLALSNRPKAR